MEPDLNTAPLQPPISDQVVTWLVLLRSGRATPADYANFLAWRDADPQHESAWQQLTGALGGAMNGRLSDAYPSAFVPPADPLPAAADPLLGGPVPPLSHPRRRFLAGTLALGACAVGAAYVGNAYYPLDGLTADAATQTGERRRYILSDGSQLLLNARSRVNLEYTSTYRKLHLLEGAVSINVQADPSRPFLVRTAEGVVRSLGTSYMVRQQARRTLVVVHEHDVEIETLAGARGLVPAGMGTRFDATRIGVPRTDLVPEAAWEHGWIEAYDRPLAEVIAALRPYRQGSLRVSMAAGGLPVRGSYPLDDTDAALRALENSMPINVRRFTPWFVSIGVLTA